MRSEGSPKYGPNDSIECKTGISQQGLGCPNNVPLAKTNDNAKGYVVEYSNLEEEFSGDETGILHQIQPVDYDREKYRITFRTDSHKHLFFSKYADWSYEQEVRIIVPLADCTKSDDLYLYQINPSCIKRIILGWNVSEEDQQKITSTVKQHNPTIEICRAKIGNSANTDSFQLSITKT